MSTDLTVQELTGFDDERLSESVWSNLAERGASKTVFQTSAWLRTWWASLGHGELLLLLVTRGDEPTLLAPLFVAGGMAFPVGAGGSDYLDLIGDTTDATSVTAMLEGLASRVPSFLGLRMYHLRDESATAGALRDAAVALGWLCVEESSQVAPFMAITEDTIQDSTSKKSLVRHQRWFEREGALEVIHGRAESDVAPHLDMFFDQHVERWAATPYPSLFADEKQRVFYRELVSAGAAAGWLRFSSILWDGKPVAFHLGFSYDGSFTWYKPTFDVALARRSPGEVLLRQLLIAAFAEGANEFDLGLGDEAFKSRFATGRRIVRDWGVYPGGLQ